MPKKAKKGGGRMEFLQQRAQAEEEMAKKREETLAQFLKDKLEKEEKNTAGNLRKLNDGWRGILRQTRDLELRQEISIFSQTFERQLDGLDNVIKDLACNLQENERRSAQGRRDHLQRLERLWALHEKRMMIVQQHWENGMQCLSSRFNSTGMKMGKLSQQQRTDLEGATITLEQQHKKVMEEIHKVYSEGISVLEKAKKLREEEMLKQKERMKLRVERREDLILFRKKKKELENMAETDHHYLQQTTKKIKDIKDLQHSVIKLREKMNSRETEKNAAIQDLKALNNEIRIKIDKLNQERSQHQSEARKQLIKLTMQSNGAMKKLQAMIAKGERVVRVGEMCRKLERKHEKVLRSSLSSSPSSPSSAAAEENHRSLTQEVKPSNQSSEFQELQQLTRRLNTAVLIRDALKKQREDLNQQNQELRLQVHQQVNNMSVGNQAPGAQHALITVSQAPTMTVLPKSNRCCNVTKAVHVSLETAPPKKSSPVKDNFINTQC
ncbi:dynein regulatory complex subunit 2 [Echeneis naucrates]|uniref:dynein regulatory complex subunit 2 n=1 Tax=Echeneis naucrates TaxID=173247 RepID=UPI0011138925|nr:dynein regulatory complex subunit 2 [Echeneis naucrates]